MNVLEHHQSPRPRLDIPNRAHLHFYFSHHLAREDVGDEDRFFSLIRSPETDLVILEAAGWTMSALTMMNLIAQGDEVAFKLANDFYNSDEGIKHPATEFQRVQAEALYGSKKKVLFIDVPKGHAYAERLHDINFEREVGEELGPTFDETIEIERKIIEEEARLQKGRDEYIYLHLTKAIPATIRRSPDLVTAINNVPGLRSKADVKIIKIIGALHEGLFHKIVRKFSNLDVSAEFVDGPLFLDHRHELLVAYQSAAEVPPPPNGNNYLSRRALCSSTNPFSLNQLGALIFIARGNT